MIWAILYGFLSGLLQSWLKAATLPYMGSTTRIKSSTTLETDDRRAQSVVLTREIRFSIDRDWATAAHGEDGFARAHPISNSWGGWPSAVGIAPYLVLQISVEGKPDVTTGYLVNIQLLDQLLRQTALPATAKLLRQSGVNLTGELLIQQLWQALKEKAEWSVVALQLWTTPFLSYAIKKDQPEMIEVTQTFEFSASHRLHVDSMSDEDNRKYFGKCNNVNGHGHNYRVEVTIGRPELDDAGRAISLPEFEAITKRCVIDLLDHKHLNADVPEFAELNPSVENITMVIWDKLSDQFGSATLRKVRVWETAKTYAEYAGN